MCIVHFHKRLRVVYIIFFIKVGERVSPKCVRVMIYLPGGIYIYSFTLLNISIYVMEYVSIGFSSSSLQLYFRGIFYIYIHL